MSTVSSVHTIGTALFGKTQRALLRLFFVRPEQSFYLRQIVRTAEIGQGAAQRELARWVEAGLLVRTQRGNQVYYHANTASPVFAELKGLAVKTAGLAKIGTDKLPHDFWHLPRPKDPKNRALEALLKERTESR
ncbi:hypothetical protein MELA_01764 [Candidatus Methylomirabilis lanthanidiphila]|uniref:ArsR family transcriptional regulator n=1 Tax=Candidatus Methylomirabilis lanthanidiphila TaxID=2211376 RepID=A0A564ZJ50_9BACT|nr:hypothetical protein [Candidatus Methylomirabilis lanthanidiphila]VUZ85380.1 hypothetical protein MELA_01764 [Candidatus Methylomirabilis lanthanidiphila]